jgi:hypothetical protein
VLGLNNDAFAALHTSSGKACRVQDAVALGRHIEWLTATDKILKQDLHQLSLERPCWWNGA